MRRVVLSLHLTVAAVAGVFLVVLGLTGSIMAFEPELAHLLHPKLWYVTAGASPLPLADLGASAMRAVPGGPVSAYLLSASPDLSYQVVVRGRTVYVNQYTGQVLGVAGNGPDWLGRIHQLHLRLLFRDAHDSGRTIVRSSAVALLFLLSSGAYLWWPLKRFSIRRGISSHRTWFDLHNVVGVFSIAFLLVATLTGIFIGFDDTFVPMAYRLTGTAPAIMYGQPLSFPLTGTGPAAITPDQAVAAARAALPGAAPILVNVPRPGSAYSVSSRYPEDLTPGGRSRVFVDPYDAHVLAAEGSRGAPAGSRLVTLNRAIHTGDVFGLPTKVLVSLASLAVVAQALSGLAVWWTKRT